MRTFNSDKVKITLIKSRFGRNPKHAGTLKGLGLKRIGHTVIRQNDPMIMGMINQVSYLLVVEEA